MSKKNDRCSYFNSSEEQEFIAEILFRVITNKDNEQTFFQNKQSITGSLQLQLHINICVVIRKLKRLCCKRALV